MKKSLEQLRTEIDANDEQILRLLSARAATALAVKHAKGTSPIYRPEREASILRRLSKADSSPLPAHSVAAIYQEIIAACRNLEQTLKVSYLGPPGSYSHEAALKLVGSSSELIAEPSLVAAIQAAEAGRSDAVLLPIENSSEGMVVETHKLLMKTHLKIMNEVVIDISHCLLSSASDLSKITHVYAHPQALGQCREWLERHVPHAELVAQPSNSRAAEVASQAKHAAAIASAKAAELFGLHILVRAINDNSTNQTRFVLLGDQAVSPSGLDKTSLICAVENRPGTLHALLGVFADERVNLIRLESQPISTSEYIFYLDLDGHQDDHNVKKALQRLPQVAKTIINLGSYPKSQRSLP